ncbi:spindle and kinetochore-associated protein 1-like [Phlebotomus papatasi]|uniref:spindle and kinetochore-associated protein 1-like n=1 Tax=Phlebotomus papatasi TaxID=29031 RepID=UPI002483C72F|nr:spindle and kinetochore-associated protein 1-like [Phlebotomus papatasi]
MDYGKILEKYFEKIEMLKLHYRICLKKEDQKEECKKLSSVTIEVQELLVKCRKLLEDFPALQVKFQNQMEKTHRQKMVMLKLAELKEEELLKKLQQQSQNLKEVTPPNRILREINADPSTFRISRLDLSTRKIRSSVKRSSSSNCKSFRKLHFPEFNFDITPDIFGRIPKHMFGRNNIDDVQNFLDTVIIKCFVDKYRILFCKRDSISLSERILYDLFRKQEKEFPNRQFITQEDVVRCVGQMIDKRTHSRIQILRHIKVLQEVRKKTTIYYLWQDKAIEI